jgi:hypothetical protein
MHGRMHNFTGDVVAAECTVAPEAVLLSDRISGLQSSPTMRCIGHDLIKPSKNFTSRRSATIPRVTTAIHVYGGDFFAANRSEWDPETPCEQRWDPERAVRRFEEANRIML